MELTKMGRCVAKRRVKDIAAEAKVGVRDIVKIMNGTTHINEEMFMIATAHTKDAKIAEVEAD